MSKNIIIQENGVDKTLSTISKVNTNEQGGGSCDWVPESEVELGNITIKANGDYKAKTYDYYAFSKAIVKASSKAVGKDKNGNWKVVTTDGNGNIIEKALPTYISVVTPPDKTVYVAGEPINKSGMVVKAYFQDDSEYGVLDLDEITLNPLIATTSGQMEPSAIIDDTTGLSSASIAAMPIKYGYNFQMTGMYNTGTQQEGLGNGIRDLVSTSPVYVFAIRTTGSITVYACSLENFSCNIYTYNENGSYQKTPRVSSGSVVAGEQFYCTDAFVSIEEQYVDSISIGLNQLDSARAIELSHIILYGTRRTGAEGTINAIWKRQDGVDLSDDFEITVTGLL